LLVEDRYRILRSLLDEPGHPYTEVFEVEDLQQGGKRKVLKTLKDQSNPKLEELFEQERKILMELRHASIPRFEDAFQVGISYPTHRALSCFVMELIEGENLEHWLNRDQRLTDESIALNWFAQIVRVLDYVHQKGFFHRDIKPSNIILKPNGQLILIDFGTARRLTQTVVNGRPVTQVYTAGYTAPEQLGGGAVPQSDFYALGRTFLHLLTGRHPADLDVQYWDTMTAFSPSDRFRDLINHCLSHDYQQRPPNAKVILSEIQAIKSPSTSSTTAASVSQTTSSPDPRSQISQSRSFPKWLKWFGFAVLGCLIVFALRYCIPDNTPMIPAIPGVSTSSPQNVEKLISYGQQSIDINSQLGVNLQRLKNRGIAELAQRDFDSAIKTFDGIRNAYSNATPNQEARTALQDPEILIYRNNAESRRRSAKDRSLLYTIAVATPLNLKNLDVAQQTLWGVAQIQDQVVNNRNPKLNLEIAIANDQGKIDQAKAIAQSLVTGVDGRAILAVVGHYTSPVTCAVLGTYSSANTVVMSSTSTAKEMRNDPQCGDSNKVFYRTPSTTENEAKTLFTAFKQQISNGRKIGVFYKAEERFSEDLRFQLKNLSDAKGIEFREKNLLDRNFNPEQALREMGDVDALAIFPDGQTEDSTAFDRAVEVLKLNQGQKLVLAANTFYNGSILSILNDLQRRNQAIDLDKRMVIAADWFSELQDAKAFRNDANRYWAGDFNHKAALAYEAVQALTAVFQSPNFNPNEMRQKLKSLDIESDIRQNRRISFEANTGDRKNPQSLPLTTSRKGDQLVFSQLQ
jgi:serine/threonine protein kinase/ABC-type branched-subunit amino acid transport system substrate-binding protein